MVKSSLYALSLYEKSMPDTLTIEEKLQLTKDYGFDAMELSIDETDAKLARLYDKDLQRALKEASLKQALPFRTLCLSGHRKYPLGSLDDSTRDKAIDIFKRAVDLARYLGASIIQLAGYDVYYDPSTAQTQARFMTHLQECMLYAASKGIFCGFETMETPFMDTVTKAVSVCKAIQSPFLCIYPDLGNITNSNLLYHTNVLEDIEHGRGMTLAVHLKDAQVGVYRNLNLGEGHVNFEACLAAFWEQGVRLFGCEFWYQDEHYKEKLASNGAYARAILDKLGESV